MRLKLLVPLITILGVVLFYIFSTLGFSDSIPQLNRPKLDAGSNANLTDNLDNGENQETFSPLSIESLKKENFPGSELIIQETLEPGSNYSRYITHYQSEGLKIYGFLTIPNGEAPAQGWPVIIFNHGFIPPLEYRTTERYVAYVDAFARNGYVVFKSDYRGHGSSEGQAGGGYSSNGYTIDVLNAVSSVKQLNDTINSGKKLVNPDKIGMWGHSMGGHITLRSMVSQKDVKVGVIWAGVVASYPDLLNNWRRGSSPQPTPSNVRRWRQLLVEQYGTPESNPTFWNSISANHYLKDISGPLQFHHGTADESVPVEFSRNLEKELKQVGKEIEYFEYPGDNHNLSNNFNTAMNRTVAFFDKYLK